MHEKCTVVLLYGYHPEEWYAKDVCLRIRDMNVDDVFVEDWGRILKGMVDKELIKRAGCRIDVHDNSRYLKGIIGKDSYEKLSAQSTPGVLRYSIDDFMGYKRARKLLYPFRNRWNATHGPECEINVLGRYRRGEEPFNLIEVEFCVLPSFPTIEDGTSFLRSFVDYLQSNLSLATKRL